MRLTEVRCYVLELAEAEELGIDRNGALEPSIHGYDRATRRFTEKRMLTAVSDLHREGWIRFAEHGLHGVYKGKAELTKLGRHWLPVATLKLVEFADLRERHAAERKAFEEKRAEELAAFEEANQVVRDEESEEDVFAAQKIAAAERVRAFLDRHAERNIAEKNIIFRVDDHVLHAGDLALLCDAVAGPR